MSCRQAREMMEEKAAREISSHEEQRLQAHLRKCSECAGLEDQLARTWDALAAHPNVEPSAEFLPKLRSHIQAERTASRPGWHWRPVLRWQLAALAVCVLITVVVSTKHDLFRPETSAVTREAKGPADHDNADDQFLRDLEETLRNSAADSLATYDSWPGMAPDTMGSEANNPKPGEGVTKKKEPA